MDDAVSTGLDDTETAEEIRLVTQLIVVATMAPGELEQDVIDDALGVEPVRASFPRQRGGS
jgi:hypothetical protein